MEKKKVYAVIGAIVIVMANLLAVILLYPPVLTVEGSGVTQNKTYNLADLESTQYDQVTNGYFKYKNDEEISKVEKYSGLSVWSLLAPIIKGDPNTLTVTITASTGYSQRLSLSVIQAAGIKIILAYGGDSFDAAQDGTIKLIVDQSVLGPNAVNSHLWIRDVVSITVA